MSKRETYFTVLRKSRRYQGQEEFLNIWGVLKYVYRVYSDKDKRFASEYTLTINEEYGDPVSEKREYKRLKKKYESKEL